MSFFTCVRQFGAASPYLLYARDQNKLKELKSDNIKYQTEASLYKEALRLANKTHWDDWAWDGISAFKTSDYAMSKAFFELSFNDPESRHSQPVNYANAVRCLPYYYCDCLKVNQLQHSNTLEPDFEAINYFEEKLSEMTNEMNRTVAQKLSYNAYNSTSELKLNMDALEAVKKVMPDCETNHVQIIINTVRVLAAKATTP